MLVPHYWPAVMVCDQIDLATFNSDMRLGAPPVFMALRLLFDRRELFEDATHGDQPAVEKGGPSALTTDQTKGRVLVGRLINHCRSADQLAQSSGPSAFVDPWWAVQ